MLRRTKSAKTDSFLGAVGSNQKAAIRYPDGPSARLRSDAKGTTAMLFTGFIASLIARFYDHQTQRLRSRAASAPAKQDDGESGDGSSGRLSQSN